MGIYLSDRNNSFVPWTKQLFGFGLQTSLYEAKSQIYRWRDCKPGRGGGLHTRYKKTSV